MPDYKRTKVDDTLRARLHGIMRTSEGDVVRQYLEDKILVMAWKALDCEGADLENIQGRAQALEEMHRDLCRERMGVDSK